MDPNIKLKTARLFVIIKKMSEIGTIAKSKPDYANLLQGSFEYEFTLFIQSGLPSADIEEKIYSCGEVDQVKITEISKDEIKQLLFNEEKKKEIQRDERAVESSSQVNVVNINLSLLDKLVEQFGELLIKSKQLEAKIINTNDSSIRNFVPNAKLHVLTSRHDLGYAVDSIVLCVGMYPRMVRNIAQRENKRVNFEYNHHDVKIDRKFCQN